MQDLWESLRSRIKTLEESMSFMKITKKCSLASLVFAAALMTLFSSGCTNTENSNANVSAGTTANANANSSAPASAGVALEAREPERYSATTIISIEPTGNTPKTNVPPLQFSFARIAGDRRVSFRLPNPVGEVIYLEKAPLKYLIFSARNQYVELDPNELGFQLGSVMSPTTVIERLKERTQFERLGTETINGRTAVKYRFKGAADTRTQAGTVEAESLVYMDQETGLPLRSEIETSTTSGAGARIVTDTQNIELNPQASLFEVPTGMKKVTSTELKQQIQSFVDTVRVFAEFVKQRTSTSIPTASQSPSDSSRSATNANRR
jgi:hypothetical protein